MHSYILIPVCVINITKHEWIFTMKHNEIQLSQFNKGDPNSNVLD